MQSTPAAAAAAVAINGTHKTHKAPSSELSGAEDSLRLYFPHHRGFRPGQLQVIQSLLQGDNAAAIFPTGGGKSLCYQLPGLMLRSEGLTLVVSPLLALMKDQVDAMRQLGHPVDLLASSLTLDEKRMVQARVRNRETAILYLAPEQLNNENSVALIRSVPIALFAVDESHCISEWGTSFRPDYLRLAQLARDWQVPRVVALTATATSQVEQDICQGFHIVPQNCTRTAFFRPNLKLCFTPTTKEERDGLLLNAIQMQQLRGATIVYATVQKTTEDVAEMLQKAGIDARPYHAGLPTDVRKETQEWFMEDSPPEEARVVVATIAFDMGVDKKDIRQVYHYNLPKSLESYAQEIGRAGRDGLDSHCQMFACLEDVAKLEAFAYCASPSFKSIHGILREVFCRQDGSFYPVGTERAISHYSIGRENDLNEQGVRMLTAFADIYHGLLVQKTPRYAQYKVKARGGPVSQVLDLFSHCGNAAAAAALKANCVVKKNMGFY